MDLYFIEQAGLPMLDGLDDAATKDAGLDPAWLAWSVQQVRVRTLANLLEPVSESALRTFQREVVASLLHRAGAKPG